MTNINAYNFASVGNRKHDGKHMLVRRSLEGSVRYCLTPTALTWQDA